jgi:DNA phosphorothioation-associated putative methyltransferase
VKFIGMKIQRHKTAMSRVDLSKPVQSAIADGLIKDGVSVFDYGCGRGGDVGRLNDRGIECAGWDPKFFPEVNPSEAEIVNIGYVINVIEDELERVDVLKKAWALTKDVLVVSARLIKEIDIINLTEYEDGHLTSRGTFHKFFEQTELRHFIDSHLLTKSVPAGPGIFYVFRDDTAREAFIAARYKRQFLAPRLRKSDVLFDEHRSLLERLMSFFLDTGRLPRDLELSSFEELTEIFGTVKRAFRVIRNVTGDEQWTQVTRTRTIEVLIYLALAKFDGRPKFSQLPSALQHDVRAFYGHYTKACEDADELLYGVGDQDFINEACIRSEIGKMTRTALYVHIDALDQLSAPLRVYEGCARGYLGQVEGANLIKIYRMKPKISYLSYPDFETNPHPDLSFSLSVDLQNFEIKTRSYENSQNPPILHRKETFVSHDFSLREKFARLTKQEEKKGLFEEPKTIGNRLEWQSKLNEKNLALRGHRLINVKID